jgi:hypothetical protein
VVRRQEDHAHDGQRTVVEVARGVPAPRSAPEELGDGSRTPEERGVQVKELAATGLPGRPPLGLTSRGRSALDGSPEPTVPGDVGLERLHQAVDLCEHLGQRRVVGLAH